MPTTFSLSLKKVMFDTLFALVELSNVDQHTLILGQEQLCLDVNSKFFPLLKTVYV